LTIPFIFKKMMTPARQGLVFFWSCVFLSGSGKAQQKPPLRTSRLRGSKKIWIRNWWCNTRSNRCRGGFVPWRGPD